MPNSPTSRAHRVLKPPQDHSVFYYVLDFDRNRFHMVDQFEVPHDGDSPCVAMLHLSRCFEYRFYRIDIIQTYYKFSAGKGWMNIHMKEEVSRNEFFSQYALGTLEGAFIATRDVEHLRKYLTHKLKEAHQ